MIKFAEGIVLVHETAHVFGMYEAYNDTPNHSTEFDMDCVMDAFNLKNSDEFYENLMKGISSPFCFSCKYELLNLTYGACEDNVFIEGNVE